MSTAKIPYSTSKVIEYLGIRLNSQETLALVSEELMKVKNSDNFVVFVRENLNNSKLAYLTPIQKLFKLVDIYVDRISLANNVTNKHIDLFCKNLYNKITDYFLMLEDKNPTINQLKAHQWHTFQYRGKNLISEKEVIVCNLLGDTPYIYRLATRNRSVLIDRITQIVHNLAKEKRKQSLGLPTANIKQLELL